MNRQTHHILRGAGTLLDLTPRGRAGTLALYEPPGSIHGALRAYQAKVGEYLFAALERAGREQAKSQAQPGEK